MTMTTYSNTNNNNVPSLNEIGNPDSTGYLLSDVGGDQPGYVTKVFVP